MRTSKIAITLACASMMLASCGGGGGSSPRPPTAGTPTPTPPTSSCSLSARQDFTLDVFREWYLFPGLLDTTVQKSAHSSLQSYINALVAPARAENKDRFFSYVTSIEEEEEFARSGSTAGFGFRLRYDSTNRRLFVIETFEGTPALGADVDRGTEILGIGTSASNIQTVESLYASGGAAAVSDALGPSNPGTTRVLRIRDQDGVERTVSLSKADFALDPVSDRYGAKIINDGGKQVGYLNLRTFSVRSAEQDLEAAFASFRAAGVTELIVDFRYNGGGFIYIAELIGDLLGRNLGGQIFDRVEWRPSKSDRNSIYRFEPQSQSIAPTKIAFITTGSTASASELVINGMLPFVDDIALIGSDTFGKPVGQSAFDNEPCDDRLRVVTLKIGNANNNFDYYDGLADSVGTTCRASDDIRFQLGDPDEDMVSTALDYLAGRSCTPFAGAGTSRLGQAEPNRGLLAPELQDRSAAQHEMPGLW